MGSEPLVIVSVVLTVLEGDLETATVSTAALAETRVVTLRAALLLVAEVDFLLLDIGANGWFVRQRELDLTLVVLNKRVKRHCSDEHYPFCCWIATRDVVANLFKKYIS